MSYTGGLGPTFAKLHERAVHAALKAGAQVYINGLREQKPIGLMGGYTTGAFVTGNLTGSIDQTEPLQYGDRWHVFVTTDVDYAVPWEMGHVNLFTRKYEREERWGPMTSAKYDDAMTAYARVYQRLMGA